MRGINRLATLGSVALFTLVCGAAQTPPPKLTYTLAQLLSRIGVSENGWDSSLLATIVMPSIKKEINGKDAVAFGTEVPGTIPLRTLHVAVRDPRTGKWIDHAIELAGDARYAINAGSINELRMERSVTYVDTHNSPSRSSTAVLDADWKLIHVLQGGVLGVLRDGTMLFQKGQPHFVYVHPLELGIFDPKSLNERLIYPHASNGPVRTAFCKELQQAFDEIPENWFRINNHPGNTEFISESLRGLHVVKERNRDTVIVNSVLDGRQFNPLNRSQNRERDVEIIAIFRNVAIPKKTQYREFRIEALRQQISFEKAADLVSPTMIERLFKLPYP